MDQELLELMIAVCNINESVSISKDSRCIKRIKYRLLRLGLCEPSSDHRFEIQAADLPTPDQITKSH